MTGVVPDGPLHPVDAALALTTGVTVAMLARGDRQRWTVMVLAAFVAVMSQRHGDDIWRAYADRPAPPVPVAATLGIVGLSAYTVARRRPPTMRIVIPVLGSLATTWAMVPDTEAALIAATLVVGAAPGLGSRDRARHAGLLIVLPVVSAVIGTVGRPHALGPALGAAALTGATIYVAMTLMSRSTRWAGTPTTVVLASTSSRTTDPAPMVAP